jgi:Fuc2NAc and GlcNAc transferase
MMLLLAAPLATVGAYILTRVIIAWAPQLGLVQMPNSRSSHVRPTPSGGGLAISIASLCLGLGLTSIGALPPNGWFFLVLACVMAALGAVDDIKDLSPLLRLFVQFSVVTASVLTVVHEAQSAFSVGYSLFIFVVVLSGTWWINLFNFMDGIDGIASVQSLILFGKDSTLDQYDLIAILTFASLIGFIPQNWPPAKLFMGDSGSMFISFILLVQMLDLVADGAIGYGAAMSLVSVLATDATVTLMRRSLAGHRPWSAHREHVYQKLARRFGHKKVTLSYAALTLFWAVPFASLATIFRISELWLSVACYAPLLAAALLVGSGREDIR